MLAHQSGCDVARKTIARPRTTERHVSEHVHLRRPPASRLFGAGSEIVAIVIVEQTSETEGQALIVEDRCLHFFGHVVFHHRPGPLLELARTLGMIDPKPVQAWQELEVGENRDVDLRTPQLFAAHLAQPLDRLGTIGLQIIHHGLRFGVEGVARNPVERGQRHVAVHSGDGKPAFEVGTRIADAETSKVHRLDGRHRSGMRPTQMVAIAADILNRQLPVAAQLHLLGFAEKRSSAWHRIQPDIEEEFCIAKIILERGRIWIEAAEDQALVFGNMGYLNQAQLAAVQFAKIGLVFQRNPRERPVWRERPPMIIAGTGLGIATIGAANAVPAVGAAVEECFDRSVFLADDDDVVLAHEGAEIVTSFGDLAGVNEEQPAATENALKLLFVELLARVDRPFLAACRRIDQVGNIHCSLHSLVAAVFSVNLP